MCAIRRKKRGKKNNMKSMLFLTIAALSIVLIVCLILLNSNSANTVADNYTFKSKISIEDVEIRGLTKQEATGKLQDAAGKLAEQKTLAFSAGEQTFTFTLREDLQDY